MEKYSSLQGIDAKDKPIVISLMENHQIFRDFFSGEITYEEMLSQITRTKPKELPIESYTKMLFALYLAHASTLRKVNTTYREHYVPLARDIDSFDFGDLSWLTEFRDRVGGKPEEVRSKGKAEDVRSNGKEEDFSVEDLGGMDDDFFREKLEELLPELPYDFAKSFEGTIAGHGHKDDGSDVTLLEHSLDVVNGHFGGFGLRTDLTIEGMPPKSVRRCLRIAALFHDSGKIHGHAGHELRSAEIAKKELEANPSAWGVSEDEIQLICSLITHESRYGKFLARRSTRTWGSIESELETGYKKLSIIISKEAYFKLLFALFLADASTLSVINEHRRDQYYPLFKNLDTLDFSEFEEIRAVKESFLMART